MHTIEISSFLDWRSMRGTVDEVLTESRLDPEFVCLNADGEWLDREAFLRHVQDEAVPTGVRETLVREHGTFTLVHGVYETNGDEKSAVRYTDVYVCEGHTRRLIQVQETWIRGTDSLLRRGEMPFCPRWNGREPKGGDGEVLLALNQSYVQAFRSCDLAWYDAHLAKEFTVVNSDGTFDDRNQALSEFAKPVYETKIRSFPVDKVRIRVRGDLALIQAENAYTLKDGRRATNRYTDLWKKSTNGTWQCIAAHITPFNPPRRNPDV